MKGVKTLTSWNGSLESLNDGSYMFSGCSKLTSFNGDLSSLINGTDMFSGCKLDEASVVHISNTIQDISSLELSKGEGTITINHDPNIPDSVILECGNRMMAKGWVVIFNALAFGVSYDITTENGYIPDASKWNTEMYKKFSLTVTSVGGGKLYNGTEEVCLIDNANIVDGSNLMKGNSKLESWNGSLESLTNGSTMFNGCSKLTSFTSNLRSLRNGTDMFKGCILDEASVVHISNTIQDISSLSLTDDEGKITINHDPNITDSVLIECGNRMMAKGWKNIELNSIIFTEYDIISENGYIPDASKWNEEVYVANKLKVTSVSGDKCYNQSKAVCFIDGENIQNGSKLMYKNTLLTSWNEPLDSLNTGDYMFAGCSKLTSFNSDLSSLQSGTSMFKGCNLDEASVVHISNTIKDISSLELSEGEGKITINHDPNIPTSVLEECFNKIVNKGWKVAFNTLKSGFGYDITDENGYIPDASKWNEEMYTPNELTITSVSNGKCYNGEDVVCLIDGENIQNGMYLMGGNTALTSWDEPLSSMTNGTMMFFYCYNLTTFNSDLRKL